MSNPTQISIRALAYGGKFIGQHVGFAQIDIYGPDDPTTPLASGLADQGLLPGTDGSGVVSFIMGQPYPWGYPIRADEATEFTTAIPLAEPTVLTFVATSMADPRISTSVSRLVIPGAPLTGVAAVVLVLQGLLVDLVVTDGPPASITAVVQMMCGSRIDNLFWPADNFNVQATISVAGETLLMPLSYFRSSLFSTGFNFPGAGDYQVNVTATEINGNCGSSPTVRATMK